MTLLADLNWVTQGLIWTVAGVVVLMYVIAPVLVWQSQSLNARAPIDALAPAYLSPEAWHYFQSTAPAFASCGFRVVLYGRISGQVPNVSIEIALWVNDRTGQAAMAGRLNTGAQYIEFYTAFADGSSVTTTTTPDVGVFKRFKEADTLSVPSITDPVELYRLHLYRETLATPRDNTRYLPDDHHAITSLQDGTEFTMLRQVKAGYYYKADDAGLFRMTLPGAFLMTWKLLPPWNQIRKASFRRRAQAQLREANANPISPPTNVRITNTSPYRSAVQLGTL